MIARGLFKRLAVEVRATCRRHQGRELLLGQLGREDALDDGLRGYASRIPESAPREVGARARADIASLLIEADELSDSWVLGVAQRAAGVGIDGGTALADNTIAEVPPSVGD